MIARLLTQLVRERLRDYPAVALVGPRQAGKTTLGKQTGILNLKSCLDLMLD